MRHPTISAVGAVTVLGTMVLASPGLAQYREYYVRGRVVDAQRKPLPDVEIALLDASTSRRFHMKTDQKGEFRVQRLEGAKAGVEEAADKIRKGDLDGAISAVNKVLEKSPQDPSALFYRVDEALVRFERGLVSKPDDAELLEMTGRCYVHDATQGGVICQISP